MKKIYGAVQNQNLCDGMGPEIVVGWFLTKAEAERVNNSLAGVQGTRNTCAVREATLFDTHKEYAACNEESIRKQALAKLTHEEKMVLGL